MSKDPIVDRELEKAFNRVMKIGGHLTITEETIDHVDTANFAITERGIERLDDNLPDLTLEDVQEGLDEII